MTDPVAALAAMPCRCHMSDGSVCWSCEAAHFDVLNTTAQQMIVAYARLRAQNATLREAAYAVVNATYKQIEEAIYELDAALAEEGG